MSNATRRRGKNLGEVELAALNYVWEHGAATAEACREALAATHPMKESTVRTVLRRLEAKGYLKHSIEGRTYIYRAAEPRRSVAARAVRQIMDRFCGGSAEELLLGMVDGQILSHGQIERLARRVAARKVSPESKDKP